LVVGLFIRFYSYIIERFYPAHLDSWGEIDMFVCLLIGVFFQPLMKAAWNRYTKTKYFEKADSMKEISFAIDSINDSVLTIDGEKFDISIESFVMGQMGYYFKQDSNGGFHLCYSVPMTIPTLTGTFRKKSDGSKYTVVSRDLVNGEPKLK